MADIEHDKMDLLVFEHLKRSIYESVHSRRLHRLNHGADECQEDGYGYVRYFVCYSSKALAELYAGANGDGKVRLSTWHPTAGQRWALDMVIPLADPRVFEKIMEFFINRCGRAFLEARAHAL